MRSAWPFALATAEEQMLASPELAADDRFDSGAPGAARRDGLRIAPLRARRRSPRPDLRRRRALPRKPGLRRRGRAPDPTPERTPPAGRSTAASSSRASAAPGHSPSSWRGSAPPCDDPRSQGRARRSRPGGAAAARCGRGGHPPARAGRARRPRGRGLGHGAPRRDARRARRPGFPAPSSSRARPSSSGTRASSPRLTRGDLLLERGTAAAVAVPLVGHGGGLYGVLAVYADAARAWRDDEVQALAALAAACLRVRGERGALPARRRGEGAKRARSSPTSPTGSSRSTATTGSSSGTRWPSR